MALQFQFAQTPSLNDFPFFNYTSVDIPAGVAVSIDTVNVLGGNVSTGPLTGMPVQGISVVPVAASGNPVVGVTQEILKAGNYGRVRIAGIAQTNADGVVTAGTFVDGSATAGRIGFAKVHVAAKAQLGLALTTAADQDPVLVLVAPALNA